MFGTNGSNNGQPTNSTADASNWMMFILRGWAASMEVFLHEFIGSRYLGPPAYAVMFWLPLYACLWGPLGAVMILFLIAYIFALIIQRMDSQSKQGQERRNHSYYTGTPILCRFLPKMSELTIKRSVEPTLLICTGIVLSPLLPPLGIYLIVGGFSLVISVKLDEAIVNSRAQDLYDSVSDQERVADRLRKMRGE